MSTHIDDLRSSSSLASGVFPTTVSISALGPTVDLADGDGACFAVQQIGDAPGDGSIVGRIEQSDDGTTWSAIAGAAFVQVEGGYDLQIIRFLRAARYLRWAATISGSSPEFAVCALIGSQKKTF